MDKGIYCITNIKNGKIYIGLTTNLKKRWNSHLYSLRTNKHGNSHLQSAFNKYGESVFCFKILERTENINEREVFWIDFFGGINSKKMYNKSSGGENGFVRSDETRAKISKWQQGRKLPELHRLNIINGNKGKKKHSDATKKYLSELYKGRPLTEETKAKISATKTGKKMTELQRLKRIGQGAKPVVRFSLSGDFIDEFSSAKEAAKKLNFWKSDITQCCMGNRKTVKGFIFKYKKQQHGS